MKFARLIFILFVLVLSAKISSAAFNNAFGGKLLARDTVPKLDSLPKGKTTNPKNYQVNRPAKAGKNTGVVKDTSSKSNSGLDDIVKGTAEDSSYTDNENKMEYYIGKARVTYGDFELDADYIRIDQKKHLIFASGRKDPKTHRYTDRPITKQKNEKPAAADSLYYNYETKKGKVFNPASQQDGNYLSGGQAKKLNDNEVAYHNVIYSTCDLPYPDTHFGIVITKGIGTKNQIISGPAYLEIEGVPLPIAIPFGFFPKLDHRSSGVMLPTFGEDGKLGFFLRNFGYYLGFNDNIDLETTGTIYSKGSYEVGTVSRYLKRYSYTGSFSLRYTSLNYGNPGDPYQKNFNILWSHTQDPNANPGSVFAASVNAGTSSFYQNSPGANNYSLQQITQNTLRSSVSYQRTWAGTPFNFTANLSHSQDLRLKTVNLELPSFTFNMSSISPFDSRNRIGEQKWYQKLSVSYSSHGTNSLTAIPESELFHGNTLGKRLQSGFKQTIPLNLNLTFLRFFQFSTNATYNEYWNFKSINQRYDRNNILNSTSPIIDTLTGFKRAGQYNLGASLSTKLYGTVQFGGRGKIKALRHILTPTFSFNYQPDYSGLNAYNKIVVSQATLPYPYLATRYNIFSQSAFPVPVSGRQAGIGINLDNTVEAKIRAKATDTSQTDKNVPILQGLSISTFYNFAADSFKLSQISLSGHTAVFNQKLSINFGGTFDPYQLNIRDSISNNQLIRYAKTVDRYVIPRLTSFYASTSFSFNSKAKNNTRGVNPQLGNINNQPIQGLTADQVSRLAVVNQDQSAFVDFNIPWNVNLSYSFNYSNTGLQTTVSNTIQARGDVNITPKWKVTYYSDIDIRAQKLSTMQLGIYRDLHCWDLSVQWIPFGYLKMYSLQLRVRASILQDLKLSKRSDYTSNPQYNPYY